ncbi:hypothetical protein NM688_g2304 [Phlebia brevispora]|uniref:Uncharacterized protein n=1 Tax=Phlebia brevispora TaxID=194682 RepID=A0ACC1T986_9APHY|nr:hypothetical protein NM688_g2304 [Phlebia brevispora]
MVTLDLPSIEHVVNIIVPEWVDVMIAGTPSRERQALNAGTIRNLCLVSSKVRSFVRKAILWTLAIDDVAQQNPIQLLRTVAAGYQSGYWDIAPLEGLPKPPVLLTVYHSLSVQGRIVAEIAETAEQLQVADLLRSDAVLWRVLANHRLESYVTVLAPNVRWLIEQKPKFEQDNATLTSDQDLPHHAKVALEVVTKYLGRIGEMDTVSLLHPAVMPTLARYALPHYCSTCAWLDKIDATPDLHPFTHMVWYGILLQSYDNRCVTSVWKEFSGLEPIEINEQLEV